MSRYLIERIEQAPRIHVLYRTEVTALLEDGALEAVVLRDKRSQHTTSTLSLSGLLTVVFIRATPSTEWLNDQLAVEDDGFLAHGSRYSIGSRRAR
jgi:thioredoxin reductase (NADPH)